MAIARRVFLFLLVNALVVLTVTTISSFFGIGNYLNQYGLDYGQLAIFCALWGTTGAFISLLMSRAIAKMSAGVQLIDERTTDPTLRQLVDVIRDLTRKAGMDTMPEIGIYDSPEPNAFATGPSASRSLIAVSTGLLQTMNWNQIVGVLGHEISHIKNGDMVTMTLLQGVVNSFVMFLSRVIAYTVTMGRRDDQEQGPGFLYFIVQIGLEIVFMILGSIVVAWFSRWREYRADKGSAALAGKRNMISALESLQRTYEMNVPQQNPAISTLQISSRPTGLLALFSSHPPLSERIKRLQELPESAINPERELSTKY